MLAFPVETQKPCSLLSFQNREQGFPDAGRRCDQDFEGYLAGAGAVLSFGVER
jgi:hypothetical protein